MFKYVIQSRLSLKYLKVTAEKIVWVWEMGEATEFDSLIETQAVAKECPKSDDPVILSVKDSEIHAVSETEYLILKSKAEVISGK